MREVSTIQRFLSMVIRDSICRKRRINCSSTARLGFRGTSRRHRRWPLGCHPSSIAGIRPGSLRPSSRPPADREAGKPISGVPGYRVCRNRYSDPLKSFPRVCSFLFPPALSRYESVHDAFQNLLRGCIMGNAEPLLDLGLSYLNISQQFKLFKQRFVFRFL